MNICITTALTAVFTSLAMCHSASAEGPFKIVTFGDSTTAPRPGVEVYTDQLRQRFSVGGISMEFINRGIGGNDTAMATQRFEKDVLAEKPQIVVIQFGINDSTVDVWKTPAKTESRISLAAFKRNMRHFITEIQKSGGKVILMTPNQLRWTDQLRGLYGKSPYDPKQEAGFSTILAKYADATRQLATEYKLPLVDVFALYDKWEKKEQSSCSNLLTDGMHPNSNGQRLVADALEAKLRGTLAEITGTADTSSAMPNVR